MGMFSMNRTLLGSDINVIANESYAGVGGAYRAMCDGYQNSYAIFEECINLDFMDAAVVQEGYSSSEFMVIQENFVTDFFNKIKEFILKLIEKVKGIVKSFIDRVVGTFTSDGKELVSKYKAQILKKDLSKMKYKFAKPTGKKIEVNDGLTLLENSFKEILLLVEDKSRLDRLTQSTQSSASNGNSNMYSYKEKDEEGKEKSTQWISDSTLERFKKDLDDHVSLEKAFGKAIDTTSCEMSEFSKEAKEYMFEDEEKETDDADKLVNNLIITLQSASQELKDINNNEKNTNKTLKETIRNIEHAQKAVLNKIPGKSDEEKASREWNTFVNSVLNMASRITTEMSTYLTKAFAVEIEMHKFHFAQTKRVWVQMAAYRPKAVKEDATLIEALGEAAEYEAYRDMYVAELN